MIGEESGFRIENGFRGNPLCLIRVALWVSVFGSICVSVCLFFSFELLDGGKMEEKLRWFDLSTF